MFQSLLIQGCVVCEYDGSEWWEHHECFNPFLFRGVLSDCIVVLISIISHSFQSLLIQGCVVCLFLKSRGWCIDKFQSLLIQGCVVCRYGYWEVVEAREFQSLLIQGCVVCFIYSRWECSKTCVSIPSYSGVCCLLEQNISADFDHTVSIPSYSGVCCLPQLKTHLKLKTHRFNPFLFRGVLSDIEAHNIRWDDCQVSIPSYSGVCCLLRLRLQLAVSEKQVSIPSYSGVCCLKDATIISVNETTGFNPFLFRGVLSGHQHTLFRIKTKTVSIPSYSGVCCLKPASNLSTPTQ